MCAIRAHLITWALSLSVLLAMSLVTSSLCVAMLLLLAHVPNAAIYFRRLMQQPHDEFAPFLVLAVAALLVHRWRSTRHDFPLNVRLPWKATVGSLAMLGVATWLGSPWLTAVSLIVTLGLLLWHFMPNFTSDYLLIWAPLLLLIRPPFDLDVLLVQQLQLETSRLAGGVLDTLRVPHVRDGNVIALRGQQFLVEEACSGIQSVFALLAATATYIGSQRVPFVRAVPLLVCGVFWACITNMLRIVIIVVSGHRFQVDLSYGMQHEVLGLLLFCAAVLLLVLTDFALRLVFDPIEDADLTAAEAIRDNPLALLWNRLIAAPARLPSHSAIPMPPSASAWGHVVIAMLVAVVTSGIAVAQLVAPPDHLRDLARLNDMDIPLSLESINADSLPETIDGWQRTGFETRRLTIASERPGSSCIWSYRTDQGSAVISLDFPFLEWHDVTSCYLGNGSTVIEYREHQQPADDDTGTALTEVILERPNGSRVLLLFTNFDEEGHDLENQSAWMHTGTPIEWLTGRMAARLEQPQSASSEVDGVITQFQLLIAFAGSEPDPALRHEARDTFTTLAGHIKRQLRSTVPSDS